MQTNSIVARFGIVFLLILSLIMTSPGCATIVRGNNQTVTIMTNPPGQVVEYQGMTLKDGDTFSLKKRFDPAQFTVKSSGRQIMVDVQYNADPLILADAALLLFFVVPGLVALGVDLGTGSWRDYDSPQIVYIPIEQDEVVPVAAETPPEELVSCAEESETQ